MLVHTAENRLQRALHLGYQHGGHIQPRTDVGHLLWVLQHGHGQLARRVGRAEGGFPAAGVGHADVRRDALLGKVALLLAVAAARSGLKRPVELGKDGLL